MNKSTGTQPGMLEVSPSRVDDAPFICFGYPCNLRVSLMHHAPDPPHVAIIITNATALGLVQKGKSQRLL